MAPAPVWQDVAPNHGVLELRETVTAPGPPLAHHLVHDSESGVTVAWWTKNDGAWLGAPLVGSG